MGKCSAELLPTTFPNPASQVIITEAAAYLQARAADFRPDTGLLLGTGLGALAREVEIEVEISYADILATTRAEPRLSALIKRVLGG